VSCIAVPCAFATSMDMHGKDQSAWRVRKNATGEARVEFTRSHVAMVVEC
jgi:hypothetical protein